MSTLLEKLMHKTFVTLTPDLGECRDSGAIVPCFCFWTNGSLGGVVLRFLSNILALVPISVFSDSLKWKQTTY